MPSLGLVKRMLSDRYSSTVRIAQSMTIAILLTVVSFAGLIVLIATPASAATGDLTVTSGQTVIIENRIDSRDGDITVLTGGTLIVRNAEIRFVSDSIHSHLMNINGGTLILDNGKITTYLDQITSNPFLNVIIQNGANVAASNNSVLQFPGTLTVSGATTSVVLSDTNITAHPYSILALYYSDVGSEIDMADDGPIISISDATFEMYDSTIWKLPEYPTALQGAENITLLGGAQFTAVNSYISADFVKDNIYTHNVIDLQGTNANAYLYGVSFAVPTDYNDRESAIVTSAGDSGVSEPGIVIEPDDTTVGESLDSLFAEDSISYQVIAGERMVVGSFGNGGMTQEPSSVVLAVKMTATSNYNGSAQIQFSINPEPYQNVGLSPIAGSTVFETVDLYGLGVTSLANVSNLRISFLHNGDTGNVQFDVLYLLLGVGPQAYIYRWADVTLADENGIPFAGAELTAKFTGSSDLQGKNAFYFAPEGILPEPPSNILTYLGKDSADYRLSDIDGQVMLPCLTDIVNEMHNPNSLVVGIFDFLATYDAHSASENGTFSVYPAMTSSNTTIQIELWIDGVLVAWDSVDRTKYLIAPENFSKTGGSYTHSGDIIIRDTGFVNLTDVLFTIDPTEKTSSRILIDDGGTLNLQGATIDSDYPVYLTVMDGGMLSVYDSEVGANVEILVQGVATVEIIGSDIGGPMSLDSDASGSLTVTNSSFSETPVLNGNVVAEFVNVSAPSVSLLGSSSVMIYRWISVEVIDGANYSLSGSTVEVVYAADMSVYATGTTDSSGIVLFKALAVMKSSSSTSYFGNYELTANYTYHSVVYESNTEAISLTGYTMPLDEDNVEITLAISDLGMPDLQLGPIGISSVPSSFTEGLPAVISADVLNDGDDSTPGAFYVYFYHTEAIPANQIGSAYQVTEILDPQESTTASTTWASPAGSSPVTIIVVINPAPISFEERDMTNNVASRTIPILTQPDLSVSEFRCEFQGMVYTPLLDSLPSGKEATFDVWVVNTGGTTINSPVKVELYVDTDPDTPIDDYTITQTLIQNTPVRVSFDDVVLEHPDGVQSEDFTYWVAINPEHTVFESNYANNNASLVVNIYDARPDLTVSEEDIVFMINSQEVQVVNYSQVLEIEVTIHNIGSYDPAENFYMNISIVGLDALNGDINRTIASELVNIVNQSDSKVISVEYTVDVTFTGNYDIRVAVDPYEDINDKNTSNNIANRTIVVEYIEPYIEIDQFVANINAGDVIYVTGMVYYPDRTTVWPNEAVTVVIQTVYQDDVSSEISGVTSASGAFNIPITVPSNLDTGDYHVVVTVGENSKRVTISVIGGAAGMDLWIWIAIIAAAVAAVVIVSIILFRKGVGKLVECGECGALIPETARKCPKCGVEFEEDMVKCSECGAWIPSTSIECPNCHVRFGMPIEEEQTFEEKMKKAYEENVLSKYRELAKEELGADYSDESFRSWWEVNPSYISFDDWMAKEDELRKQVSPIVCKVCGTSNARGSTVCQSCGTPLPIEKKVTVKPIPVDRAQTEEVMVEKRVIRKPIDRKIVPKKVIKKPLDEEDDKGKNNQ
ncbi:MAG TPA: hypothetical protein ENN25_06950 [Euryarchaeota archaeon]|nr:hypothetical protein [Euryarchaeota archaeon]